MPIYGNMVQIQLESMTFESIFNEFDTSIYSINEGVSLKGIGAEIKELFTRFIEFLKKVKIKIMEFFNKHFGLFEKKLKKLKEAEDKVKKANPNSDNNTNSSDTNDNSFSSKDQTNTKSYNTNSNRSNNSNEEKRYSIEQQHKESEKKNETASIEYKDYDDLYSYFSRSMTSNFKWTYLKYIKIFMRKHNFEYDDVSLQDYLEKQDLDDIKSNFVFDYNDQFGIKISEEDYSVENVKQAMKEKIDKIINNAPTRTKKFNLDSKPEIYVHKLYYYNELNILFKNKKDEVLSFINDQIKESEEIIKTGTMMVQNKQKTETHEVKANAKIVSILSEQVKLLTDRINIINYYFTQFTSAYNLMLNEEWRFRKEGAKELGIDVYDKDK